MTTTEGTRKVWTLGLAMLGVIAAIIIVACASTLDDCGPELQPAQEVTYGVDR